MLPLLRGLGDLTGPWGLGALGYRQKGDGMLVKTMLFLGAFVVAREAYNIIKAAEAGHDGNPGDFRDFDIPPPANTRQSAADTAPPPGQGGLA